MILNQTVEIIIPVYNNLEGLNRCLESLSTQIRGISGVQVTVVDNGSFPAVPNLSLVFPFVSVLLCETQGAYAARNAAAKNSRADVLVFLDSDCEASDSWLEQGLAALVRTPGAQIVGGEVLFFASRNPTATEAYQLITGFEQQLNIQYRGFTATANLFVWRKVLEKVGSFNEQLLSGGDREWCWRAAKIGGRVVYAESAIVLTAPRRSLRNAIVQVRRVVGGRSRLIKAGTVQPCKKKHLAPEKKLGKKIKKIAMASSFTIFMRLRILFVAAVLLIVRNFEKLRLLLGGAEERR